VTVKLKPAIERALFSVTEVDRAALSAMAARFKGIAIKLGLSRSIVSGGAVRNTCGPRPRRGRRSAIGSVTDFQRAGLVDLLSREDAPNNEGDNESIDQEKGLCLHLVIVICSQRYFNGTLEVFMAFGTNPFDQQKKIEGVKNIIAVGAGKGGVGKSTVAVNLAAALQKQGFSVGLLDADIYGPSIPKMVGLTNARPNVAANKRIQPLISHGMKTMSIGYLVDDKSAIIWRGPMLFKAIDQFLREVEWGEIDYLIVDLPPGTGDVQLSLVQKVPVTGAVIVSTPQDLALADVKRCVDMFERVKVPIIGLVENMSVFVCPHCTQPTKLFHTGELQRFCDEKKIAILTSVPFNPVIGDAAETGTPYVTAYESAEERAFNNAASEIVARTK
jgi:ATP-binding protein involved in chromosome partitioning